MSRWTPDGKERLLDAALDLFTEHGYSGTTVAAVAARAGLTQRTFFRYFADKKEVLFPDNDLTGTVRAATAASAAPSALGMAVTGLRAVAEHIQAEPARVRKRAAVISATPELREREMLKISQWTTAAVEALTDRGVGPRAARVSAEVATALFRIAYSDWTADDAGADLASTLDDLFEVHRRVTIAEPGADAAPAGGPTAAG